MIAVILPHFFQLLRGQIRPHLLGRVRSRSHHNQVRSELKSLSYGNGQTLMRSFDQDGRISSYTLGDTASDGALYQLTRDAAGRISAIDQMLPTTQLGQAIASYGYDELDRLTQVTPRLSTNPQFSYQYDLNGNRSQRQQISTGSSSTQTSLIAATSNRLHSLDGVVQTYDANGNLTADKLVSRTYDARNRLIQAITAQQTLSFEVNALGQRVRKSGSNLTLSPDTVYHYDSQGRLLAESPTPTGNVIFAPSKEYIWLGDLPLVVYAGTTPYYIHSDHLNTPRLISDAQGQTRWYWLNDEAFGANAPNEQPNPSLAKFEFNLRFPGQYWDKETATSYNYFRDYNPQTGRYTTPDPVGNVLYKDMAIRNLAMNVPVSPALAAQLYRGSPIYNHLYNYVNAQPLTFTDPMGLQSYMCDNAGLSAWCPPPPPPPPTCCNKEALSGCLLDKGLSGGKDCIACAISRGRNKLACDACMVNSADMGSCFIENCGRDKCKDCNK